MNFSDYLKIDAVNWSTLRSLRVSPLQYLHDRDTERADTPFFRVGRCMHCMVLEPDKLADNFVCYPDRRAGKAWEAFKAEHEGKAILNTPEWTKAHDAAQAILEHPVAAPILRAGFKEAVMQWDDTDTGIRCKGRVDHCGSRLVDLKSTSTIDPWMFGKAAHRLGYHGQAAFYSDGLAANGITTTEPPCFIVVQSEPPHDVVVYNVPDHVVDLGRSLYKELLLKLAECRASGSWPGLAPEPIELVLPEYAYRTDDDGLELVIGGEKVAL